MSDSLEEFLPSDQYYIRNANEDTYAGRNRIEDKSLLPKRVYCPPDDSPELWIIERLPNGRYKIRARGAPTAEIDNLLFALLIDGHHPADEWIIKRRRSDGHRPLYTIEKADGKGWVKQVNVEVPQIAVRPLIVTPSEPPQFQPIALWNIQPLVE